jgi:hypothetical protein
VEDEKPDQISRVIRYGEWVVLVKAGFYKEVHRWAQESLVK